MGAQRMYAPPGRNSFNFMQFLEILAKSCIGAPPPRGLAPNHGEILDSPLDISEIGYDLK